MSHRTRGSIPAVAATFAVGGLLLAQALSRMPSLRDQVSATSAQLGFALVGSGIGSLLAMPWTARLVERWGSKATVFVAAALASAGCASLSLVRSPLQLWFVMLAVGAGVGVWDVAMNVQGHGVEKLRGLSLMPRLHAAYSAGGLLGALLGALTARLAVPLSVQLPAAGALAVGAILVCVRRFVPDSAQDQADAAEVSGAGPDSVPGLPARGITAAEIVIGFICLSTAIGEGAANDWLALLLVDVRDAPEAFGALTFAAFNVTMLVGRLAGGPAIQRFGRVAVLRASGLCAMSGVLLVCLVPSLYAAVAGGLLWGLGLATVFPATMSAAGEIPGRGQRAIGVVSTVGYGGFLLGAPSIGLLTAHIGLDRALLLIAGFGALIVLLAQVAAPRPGVAPTMVEPDTSLLR